MTVTLLALICFVATPAGGLILGAILGATYWTIEKYVVKFHAVSDSFAKNVFGTSMIFGIFTLIIGAGCFLYGLAYFELV